MDLPVEAVDVLVEASEAEDRRRHQDDVGFVCRRRGRAGCNGWGRGFPCESSLLNAVRCKDRGKLFWIPPLPVTFVVDAAPPRRCIPLLRIRCNPTAEVVRQECVGSTDALGACGSPSCGGKARTQNEYVARRSHVDCISCHVTHGTKSKSLRLTYKSSK